MPVLKWGRCSGLWLSLMLVLVPGGVCLRGAAVAGLEGRWKVEAGEVDGKRMPSKGLAYYIIEGNRMTFSNGLEERTFDYVIDAEAKPMTMDQVMRVDGERLVTRSIFALDGDTLRICGSVLPGRERPEAFSTRPGDDLVLFELRRVADEVGDAGRLQLLPHFVALQKIGARFELNGEGEVRTVLLSTTRVADDDLKWLRDFPALSSVSLALTGVGDAGLRTIGRLPRLERLNLSHTRVTDRGLRQLKEVRSLEVLQVAGTGVTVGGLLELKSLPKLRSVDLDEGRVGEEGMARLRKAMPGCVFE